ncbi:Glycine dehydrogenase [Golovinomyces cichoracearum]|uniref:Glycine cleavage system P protein n=1 Tax=Golovinomyces cichoracearum TaxID=62708 RepID=A0A420J7D8_9PEZI|nr:Glycine dehydrogenase [Golovinomyces cichoracearum]
MVIRVALQQCARNRIISPGGKLQFIRLPSVNRFMDRGFKSIALSQSKQEGEAISSPTSLPSTLYDEAFLPLDTFSRRHIGPSDSCIPKMLRELDPPVKSLDELIEQVIPADILLDTDLKIDTEKSANKDAFTETEVLDLLQSKIESKDSQMARSYIGCGYANTIVPSVIKRNVLENPGWYTSYTPYQPEISQGRLESLLNFQTLVSDLTALPIANASLLDEPTAAAEALTLSFNSLPIPRQKNPNKVYFVSHLVHPQTKAVIQSRADGFGVKIEIGDVLANGSHRVKQLGKDLVGVLVQYPDTEGGVEDFRALADIIHRHDATLSVATDLLALTVLTPPGEFGADVAFGNSQRFGVPLGFGGPHAAFFAVNEKLKRKLPGRLIGISKDRLGNRALRLSLQTREQHIRREKATSNVCTAQALLANMAAFYAIYHGPLGLKNIAQKLIAGARILEEGIRQLGFDTGSRGLGEDGRVLFDTVIVKIPGNARKLQELALSAQNINLRLVDNDKIGITVDETMKISDLEDIISIFSLYLQKDPSKFQLKDLVGSLDKILIQTKSKFMRSSKFLSHPVFNMYHSETELLRYIQLLQSRDLSLVHSMIPLGSCTMKLNATTEMTPISWPQFSNVHPFVPTSQTSGYISMIDDLKTDLATITGFDDVSLQPNSGAQGEFAGLRVISEYHKHNSNSKRDICLIPVSAHGTNPASALMAGFRVVTIKCDAKTGDLDMSDLKQKCEKYSDNLGAIMVTYPSTFGVFEPGIRSICDLIHEHGGQVYMDGANMNAQIGLCSPGDIGADVCHLNLHKTFCIPHGGGGPGVGPIGVKAHLAPFLPGHPLVKTGGNLAIPPVSGAPYGSASILPISWTYIKMMGGRGLTNATKVTILNANYMMSRLRPHYTILYTNANLRCAHEFILDVRGFKETANIEAIDITKRLIDYGFHAPTMSWPIANTLMVEPTESENKEELDRYVDALISIRDEIRDVEEGRVSKDLNILKMAPHTQEDLIASEWNRPYTREKAAFPLPWLKDRKFWPSVARVDDAFGDKNLFCTCSPVESIDGAEETGDITGTAAPIPI